MSCRGRAAAVSVDPRGVSSIRGQVRSVCVQFVKLYLSDATRFVPVFFRLMNRATRHALSLYLVFHCFLILFLLTYSVTHSSKSVTQHTYSIPHSRLITQRHLKCAPQHSPLEIGRDMFRRGVRGAHICVTMPPSLTYT